MPAICVASGVLFSSVWQHKSPVSVCVCGNASDWMEWVMWKLCVIAFALCFVPLFVFNLFVQIFLVALAKFRIATFCFRTELFWAIAQRVDININFYGVYMWSALILIRCYWNLNFSRQIFRKFLIHKISWKSVKWEPNFFPWGRTDGRVGRQAGMTQLIVSFCNFASAPKY
jgi:hypothetical protein